MKTFLVTSAGTFSAIIEADRYSRQFEFNRDPSRQYRDRASLDQDAARENATTTQKMLDWGRENRYPIVTVSWIASMGIALGLVGKNPYLSKAQKLVQARVYAQGLTLAVLIATAAFEVGDASKGKGRWETIKVIDPNDPEHKHLIEKRIHHEAYEGEDLWRDMVATEERKIAARRNAAHHEAEEHETEKKGDSPPGYTPSSKPDPKSKGKANKDRIVSESKSAGSVDHAEAAKIEEKNMKRQNEKEGAAKTSAAADGAKVKDRGEYSGR